MWRQPAHRCSQLKIRSMRLPVSLCTRWQRVPRSAPRGPTSSACIASLDRRVAPAVFHCVGASRGLIKKPWTARRPLSRQCIDILEFAAESRLTRVSGANSSAQAPGVREDFLLTVTQRGTGGISNRRRSDAVFCNTRPKRETARRTRNRPRHTPPRRHHNKENEVRPRAHARPVHPAAGEPEARHERG